MPSERPQQHGRARRGRLRAGDLVSVRSPAEILATLDADGTLDGLPFMPEMLSWCGKTVRVERRAEKTCVAVPRPAYGNRRFAANDVVFLDGPRCDGGEHDGCKRGCKIFWKEEWLRPADGPRIPAKPAGADLEELRNRLRTTSGENRYFCQSTQLLAATEDFPGRKKIWMGRIAVREVRNGDRSLGEIITLFARWVRLKAQHLVRGDDWLRGSLARTPNASLGLLPGEVVRVRSESEIEATLDRARSNKGLKICAEMTRFFGGSGTVHDRVDRMIDEHTGEMRTIRDTVSLDDLRTEDGRRGPDCLCAGELGDCPRAELMYWREIWLERVPATTGT